MTMSLAEQAEVGHVAGLAAGQEEDVLGDNRG